MINYLHNCDLQNLQDFPYCVIGSGAAGITIAIALSGKGHRVLLIETGDWNEHPDLDDFYTGQAEFPHPPITEYRHQRFGGTTHLWGGRCVPFDDVDFDERREVPNSGWPISYQEVAAYYPKAMAYCDAGAPDFSIQSLSGIEKPMFDSLPNLQPDLFERIERYSLPTDFSKKYRDQLLKSSLINVLLKTRCTRLIISKDGSRIESIELSSGDQKVMLRADNFVLCGGGIEITRLLLSSRDFSSSWARFDNSLGKYYACHFDLIFGELVFNGKKPLFDFEKTKDGIYARRKLQFSKEFQSAHGLSNSTFRLHFPAYADAAHGSGVLSTIFLAKSVLSSEHQSILNHGAIRPIEQIDHLAHLQNVVTDLRSVFSFGYDWLFKIKLAQRKLPYTLVPNRNGSYPLEFNGEQIPDQSNRIELLPETDKEGVRRISVHWKLTETDIASGIESFVQFKRLMAGLDNCKLEFDYAELKERMAGALPVGGHHIGTTRMGRSVENSVVDTNCQLHGVDNLFVASSSVFPTSSHANPTLTIVALALRLVDYLDSISHSKS